MANRKRLPKKFRPQLTKAYAAMFLDEAHRVTRLSELIDSRGDDIFREKHDPLDYYTCASAFYRIEWLLRNGRLASTFGPAKYHLVAGVKTYILGPDRLPNGVRLRKAACEKILAEVWDIDRSNRSGPSPPAADPGGRATRRPSCPSVRCGQNLPVPHERTQRRHEAV
jgi:hypothetical protein